MNPTVRARAFLTAHARVLLAIARDPACRVRDIALACHITERATSNVVRDLETAGYLTRRRVGRNTRYTIDADRALHHPSEAHLSVGRLLTLATPVPQAGERATPVTRAEGRGSGPTAPW
ncbi:MarR family transcriptional regulator [Streptomyces lasalocidi]|uniref:MarR family transcriptional regulator n=1 Tax=Streptomyces lasalocidi TaxID=324833 RepID=A0A4U5WB43_STRLS|nr:helix-turn-helix domain-containing protein [Streptomyces lasalocidi]TKS98888.1 MarR family transcriptional regulator [Streptomyces lasalocidi]